MIKEFTIENFKSFKKATLKLSPLTLLVGANASGKSNALEAIRFLSWLAQGQKLSALQYQVNQNAQVVRGRVNDILRYGLKSFNLGCIVDNTLPATIAKIQTNSHKDLRLQLEFEINDKEELSIVNEFCKDFANGTLYNVINKTESQVEITYNDFSINTEKPRIKYSNQQALFIQLSTLPFINEVHKNTLHVLQATDLLESNLSHISFLDPLPSQMRAYSFLQDRNLAENGQNLSSVLYHLWNENEETKELLLSFVRNLPEQNIKSIDFLKGPRDEVMIQLVETFGDSEKSTDASLLSDGTLRVLAIAASLLSAKNDTTVVIEEIDNGVHPSRARDLLKSIYNLAEKKRLVVLVSSHNPALMDALPPEAIPNVVFCYRDPKDGSSQLTTLADIENYPELITQGTLGDLVTDGILEHFVKHQEDVETKKQNALAWIESLKK